MATYKTPSGEKVKATETENDQGMTIWSIEYPDGEVREAHPDDFAAGFKKVS